MPALHPVQDGDCCCATLSPLLQVMQKQPQWVYSDQGHLNWRHRSEQNTAVWGYICPSIKLCRVSLAWLSHTTQTSHLIHKLHTNTCMPTNCHRDSNLHLSCVVLSICIMQYVLYCILLEFKTSYHLAIYSKGLKQFCQTKLEDWKSWQSCRLTFSSGCFCNCSQSPSFTLKPSFIKNIQKDELSHHIDTLGRNSGDLVMQRMKPAKMLVHCPKFWLAKPLKQSDACPCHLIKHAHGQTPPLHAKGSILNL